MGHGLGLSEGGDLPAMDLALELLENFHGGMRLEC
jgi:hypothetical protein